MRSINPTCKFIGILLPTLLLAIFYKPILNLTVFVLCIVLLMASRVPMRFMAKALVPVLILAIGMFVTGYQFPSGASLGVQHLLFTDARIYNGLQLSSRVVAFAGLGALFICTTDKLDFVRSLEQQLHLPPRFAYGILASWGMLPYMKYEYKKTYAAFYARGLHPFPFSTAVLVPLLVKAVRWSEALACAMESKGFGEGKGRTYYHTLYVGGKDISFPILTTALIAAGLVFMN